MFFIWFPLTTSRFIFSQQNFNCGRENHQDKRGFEPDTETRKLTSMNRSGISWNVVTPPLLIGITAMKHADRHVHRWPRYLQWLTGYQNGMKLGSLFESKWFMQKTNKKSCGSTRWASSPGQAVARSNLVHVSSVGGANARVRGTLGTRPCSPGAEIPPRHLYFSSHTPRWRFRHQTSVHLLAALWLACWRFAYRSLTTRPSGVLLRNSSQNNQLWWQEAETDNKRTNAVDASLTGDHGYGAWRSWRSPWTRTKTLDIKDLIILPFPYY